MLLTSLITGVQFSLLGQTATTYLIAVSAVYSILLILENKISFVRSHAFTAGLLSVQIAGYFLINGFSMNWSLLALLGTVVGTFSMWFQDPIKLKASMLILGGVWLTYQLISGAYGQIPGELVFISGIIISLTMLTNAKRQGKPLNTVEELPILARRKFREWKQSESSVVQDEVPVAQKQLATAQ